MGEVGQSVRGTARGARSGESLRLLEQTQPFFEWGRSITLLVRHRQWSVLWRMVREKAYSDSVSLGLRRDLTISSPRPAARIPVTVRPLRPEDVPNLLAFDPELDSSAVAQRLSLRRLLAAGMDTCYVAVTADGNPCYVTWLILPDQNHRLQTYFRGAVPPLECDEVLLEGAFTLEAYRGQGIMRDAGAQIRELAREAGAGWAIAYADAGNIPSLKVLGHAGYVPFLRRDMRWRLFRRRIRLTRLPEQTPLPLETDRERFTAGETSNHG